MIMTNAMEINTTMKLYRKEMTSMNKRVKKRIKIWSKGGTYYNRPKNQQRALWLNMYYSNNGFYIKMVGFSVQIKKLLMFKNKFLNIF